MTQVPTRSAGPTPQTASWLVMIGAAGLVLGISGLFMIVALPAVGLVWYGGLLVLLGLAQLGELFRRLTVAGRTIRALLALTYVVCGVVLMMAPASVDALKLLIAVLFTAAGAFRILWSFTWTRWSKVWGIGAGLASIALGAVMLLGWPTSALWVLGAAVAFDLAAYGVTAILLGRALKA